MDDALVNPYCSVEDVCGELKNAALPRPTAIRAINAASRWIDRFTRRDFYQHDYSVTPLEIDAESIDVCEQFWFAPWPILTLTAVTYQGTAWVLNTDYVLQANRAGQNIRLKSLNGRLALGNAPDDTLKLTGTFGYAQSSSGEVPTDIPQEIRHAAIQIAAAFTSENMRDVVGLDGSKTAVLDKEVPKSAREILEMFQTQLI